MNNNNNFFYLKLFINNNIIMSISFIYLSLFAIYFIIYPIKNPPITSLQSISNDLNKEVNDLRLIIKAKDENLKNIRINIIDFDSIKIYNERFYNDNKK
jgi:hypothetical protein